MLAKVDTFIEKLTSLEEEMRRREEEEKRREAEEMRREEEERRKKEEERRRMEEETRRAMSENEKRIQQEEEKSRILREESQRRKREEEEMNDRQMRQKEQEAIQKKRDEEEQRAHKVRQEEELRMKLQREKEEWEMRQRIILEEERVRKTWEQVERNTRAAKEEVDAAREMSQRAEEAMLAAELVIRQQAKVMKESIETQTEENPAPVRPPLPKEEEDPRPVAPIFTEGLEDLVMDEGVGCVLQAKVSGVPSPVITWFKDGIPVASNTDYVTECLGGACSLSIEETLREDSANWTCRASNQAGYAESHAKLTVQEVRMPEPLEPEPHKPAFYVPLSNTQCEELGEAVLECVIIGWPEPEVIWYHGDTPVREATNCRLQFEGDACRLLLSKVSLPCGGDYTVRAVNKCGECRSSCRLTVDRKQLSPVFLRRLQSQSLPAGARLVLEVEVGGQPGPMVSWWRGEERLEEGPEIHIRREGSTHSVVIQSLQVIHYELYPSCRIYVGAPQWTVPGQSHQSGRRGTTSAPALSSLVHRLSVLLTSLSSRPPAPRPVRWTLLCPRTGLSPGMYLPSSI